MALTDEEFREEFKPLQVPPAYSEAESLEEKILFALAEAGEANASEVCDRLTVLDPDLRKEDLGEKVKSYLLRQFDKGLLNGGKKEGLMYFNLAKITHSNKGKVDPDLLAPGLD